MRFRKSIKLLPGVRVNLSNSGISTSVGPKGASVNLKPGRNTRATVSLPGTGLSHTETIGSTPRRAEQAELPPEQAGPPPPLWASILGAIWGALRFIVVGIVIAGIAALIAMAFSGSSKKR